MQRTCDLRLQLLVNGWRAYLSIGTNEPPRNAQNLFRAATWKKLQICGQEIYTRRCGERVSRLEKERKRNLNSPQKSQAKPYSLLWRRMSPHHTLPMLAICRTTKRSKVTCSRTSGRCTLTATWHPKKSSTIQHMLGNMSNVLSNEPIYFISINIYDTI